MALFAKHWQCAALLFLDTSCHQVKRAKKIRCDFSEFWFREPEKLAHIPKGASAHSSLAKTPMGLVALAGSHRPSAKRKVETE